MKSSREHMERLIPLYLYDELNEMERRTFDRHLEACRSCQDKVAQARAAKALMDRKIQLEPTEALLERARLNLRNRLRAEQKPMVRTSFWERLYDFALAWRMRLEVVGAVTLLLLGFFAGRTIWVARGVPESQAPELVVEKRPLTGQEPHISDIDLIHYNPENGQVVVQYKSINDVHLQGNIEDPGIQNILTHVIRSESHPGRRLTAVRALNQPAGAEPDLVKALIYAVEKDTVDGVRLRAARVLHSMKLTAEIKHAFVRVLHKDPNPAIRMIAVEALSGALNDREVRPVFLEAAKDDENEYIRLLTSRAIDRSKLERVENPPRGR